jgi:hypothetical protein
MTDDAADEVRRLRGVVRGLEDDNASLREPSPTRGRKSSGSVRRSSRASACFKTGEPVDRKHGALVPVTAAALDAALARLHQVRPLPPA